MNLQFNRFTRLFVLSHDICRYVCGGANVWLRPTFVNVVNGAALCKCTSPGFGTDLLTDTQNYSLPSSINRVERLKNNIADHEYAAQSRNAPRAGLAASPIVCHPPRNCCTLPLPPEGLLTHYQGPFSALRGDLVVP